MNLVPDGGGWYRRYQEVGGGWAVPSVLLMWSMPWWIPLTGADPSHVHERRQFVVADQCLRGQGGDIGVNCLRSCSLLTDGLR